MLTSGIRCSDQNWANLTSRWTTYRNSNSENNMARFLTRFLARCLTRFVIRFLTRTWVGYWPDSWPGFWPGVWTDFGIWANNNNYNPPSIAFYSLITALYSLTIALYSRVIAPYSLLQPSYCPVLPNNNLPRRSLASARESPLPVAPL